MTPPSLETTVPLTPLQQGIFFTWLPDPAAGIGVGQMVNTLPEAVDPPGSAPRGNT